MGKTIIQKLPPLEKIFGFAWILCWFAAIWIYHIQFFLMGLFCLFLAFVIFDRTGVKAKSEVPLSLAMDKSSKTLTVQKLYENNLKWEESEICSGDAMLPSGTIKEGDVITDCNGNVALRHIPSNVLFGAYNFE